jgi:hypothetical protein
MTTTTTVEDLILQTDASGAPVRLEYVRGRLHGNGVDTKKQRRSIERRCTFPKGPVRISKESVAGRVGFEPT